MLKYFGLQRLVHFCKYEEVWWLYLDSRFGTNSFLHSIAPYLIAWIFSQSINQSLMESIFYSLLPLNRKVEMYSTAISIVLGNTCLPSIKRCTMFFGIQSHILIGTESRSTKFRRDAKYPNTCTQDDEEEIFPVVESTDIFIIGWREIHAEAGCCCKFLCCNVWVVRRVGGGDGIGKVMWWHHGRRTRW